jgi:hypothetical protein
MNKKITLSKMIKDKHAVIHCSKEEQAEAYAKAMDEMGQKRIDGKSYLKDNCWSLYKGETCYRPSTNQFCYLSWYGFFGLKVYEFDEVDMEIKLLYVCFVVRFKVKNSFSFRAICYDCFDFEEGQTFDEESCLEKAKKEGEIVKEIYEYE